MLESCRGVLCRAMRVGLVACAGLVVACSVVPAEGATISDLGFQWCRVGDAGNRGTTPAEMRNRPSQNYEANPSLGAIAYEFNIAKTEMTLGQYAQFVRAYAPVWRARNPAANTLPRDLLGTQIQFFGGQVTLFGDERSAYGMTFEYAARMCNWLHNGMSSAPEAFDNGAYDMSRFGVPITPGGQPIGWPERNPGATYWIPSIHEWTKAAYWDPSKVAPDGSQGGYWQYSGMQDTPLLGGHPGVGQTDAWTGTNFPLPGSYPDVASPWGLLDTSGGLDEWTETSNPLASGSVYVKNSRAGFINDDYSDRLGNIFTTNYPKSTNRYGLRLVNSVPTPSQAWLIGMTSLWSLGRRKRT
jgi:sulfatase modifying factor 1